MTSARLGVLGLAIAAAILGAGCRATGVGSSPSPTAAPDGVEALVADLRGAGARATVGANFSTAPLSGRGVQVCVDGEPLNVYVFSSPEERARAAARIDRVDPARVGNAIVDWVGPPWFWQRDRILVLYLGGSSATGQLLTSVLGDPFAKGQGPPPESPERCG